MILAALVDAFVKGAGVAVAVFLAAQKKWKGPPGVSDSPPERKEILFGVVFCKVYSYNDIGKY